MLVAEFNVAHRVVGRIRIWPAVGVQSVRVRAAVRVQEIAVVRVNLSCDIDELPDGDGGDVGYGGGSEHVIHSDVRVRPDVDRDQARIAVLTQSVHERCAQDVQLSGSPAGHDAPDVILNGALKGCADVDLLGSERGEGCRPGR